MDPDLYGFREPPFQMTPDVRLFFPSTVHSRAYAHLLYGLSQREGFVVVTGEVGAGKTTLIERLCAEFSTKNHAIARVMTTQVEATELLRLVAMAFGASANGSKAELLQGVVAALRRGVAENGQRNILIVDEAQALPVPSLEELRMLSNVNEGGRALLQVVLMGQPQLRHTLARPDLDQLRQRVLAAYHLAALTREETRLYVRHRMSSVGWTGYPAWEETALDLVYEHSDGVPRRINRLCSRVLLAGALEHAAVLTAELVRTTAEELTQDLGAICAEAPPLRHGAEDGTLRSLSDSSDGGGGSRSEPESAPLRSPSASSDDRGGSRSQPESATLHSLSDSSDGGGGSRSEPEDATLRSLSALVDQLELSEQRHERALHRLQELAERSAAAGGRT